MFDAWTTSSRPTHQKTAWAPHRLHALRSAVDRRKGAQSQRAARRNADAETRASETAATTPRLAGRGARLDEEPPRSRAFPALARTRRGPRYLPTASPVNRGAVRAESAALLDIATRSRISTVRSRRKGLVLADGLLMDGSGPLYDRERAGELPAFLDATLEALEPSHADGRAPRRRDRCALLRAQPSG